MSGRLLILGASARAAAASARRAGFEPFAIDLFADADTRRICDCLKCPPEDYPNGLFRLARQAPPMPWMYTGGLENDPELVGELAAERELWGNGPEVLTHVRDPFRLADRFDSYPHPSSFAAPSPAGSNPGEGGNWLRKPRRGSGGAGIRPATAADFGPPGDPTWFLQSFVPGRPMSALFRSAREGYPTLLGVARQLVGEPWLHAGRFRYAGNLTADERPSAVDLTRLASDLIADFGLTGVWGFDYVEQGREVWVVEVNPRYAASAEVHEHARGTSVFDRWYVDTRRPRPVVGKAVYYAPHRIVFPASGPWDDSLARACDVWRRPDYADLPHAGDVIDRGHPVLTILAEAATEADCLARLQSRAADLDHLFGVRP